MKLFWKSIFSSFLTIAFFGLNSVSCGPEEKTSNQPKPVPGVFQVTSIAAGDDHTRVATSNGEVLCWGANMESQTGAVPQSSLAPLTLVPGMTKEIIAVASGSAHSCTLFASNDVYFWGRNEERQLGR